MAFTSDAELSDAQSRAIAIVIREELARRRLSRQKLADLAKISLSTLEKALSGRRPFTLATTIRLEEALARPLRTPAAAPIQVKPAAGIAPDELGFYSRQAVTWIEGAYLTLRPSFSDKRALYAYRTEIYWSEPVSRMLFRESERLDAAFTQDGAVSVPNQSGHIYLVTNRHGQIRLIVVARPTIAGEMYGILTTLQAGRGAQLMPVAAPIAFVPLEGLNNVQFGRVESHMPCHAAYRSHLARVTDEPFAMFLP